jgi:hypothetical protein
MSTVIFAASGRTSLLTSSQRVGRDFGSETSIQESICLVEHEE